LCPVKGQGPNISSRACLLVLPSPCHHPQCWLTNQQLILLLISWLLHYTEVYSCMYPAQRWRQRQ
jgi:hypothetical protein